MKFKWYKLFIVRRNSKPFKQVTIWEINLIATNAENIHFYMINSQMIKRAKLESHKSLKFYHQHDP